MLKNTTFDLNHVLINVGISINTKCREVN